MYRARFDPLGDYKPFTLIYLSVTPAPSGPDPPNRDIHVAMGCFANHAITRSAIAQGRSTGWRCWPPGTATTSA